MKKIVFILFYAVLPLIVLAQDTTIVEIKPVYVKRDINKMLVFYNNVDSSFIKESDNVQLSDFIQYSTSAYIKSFGNYGVSTASFRGTGATHTQVYWNNIPLNSPMLGQTDFSLIPVFFSDKISVAEGVSSMSYNSGALGGSIILGTKLYSQKTFEIEANSSLASFHNYNNSLGLTFHKNKLISNTRLLYSFGKNDFTFYNSAIPEVGYEKLKDANYSQFSVLQQFGYQLTKKSNLKLYAWLNFSNRDIPPIMSFDGFKRIENQKDTSCVLGIDYSRREYNSELNVSFAYRTNRMKYFLADSIYSDPVNEQIIKNNSLSNEDMFHSFIEYNYDFFEKSRIEVSLKSAYYNVNSFDNATYVQNGYNATRLENFLGLVFYHSITRNLLLSVLSNITSIDKKIYKPDFAINFTTNVNSTKPLKFGLNVGKNSHYPTLNDLYWQPGGNPELLPESGFSADALCSVSLRNDSLKFNLELKPFVSLIDNWIIWKPTEFHYWTAENIKQVFSRGVSTNITFQKNGKFSYKTVINYSFTLTTNIKTFMPDDESIGKQLIYVPKNKANVFLYFYFKNYTLNLNSNYVGLIYTTSSNLDFNSLDQYFLLNFFISKKIELNKFNFILKFELNNLLNQDYESVLYRPMPGRNFKLSVSFRI